MKRSGIRSLLFLFLCAYFGGLGLNLNGCGLVSILRAVRSAICWRTLQNGASLSLDFHGFRDGSRVEFEGDIRGLLGKNGNLRLLSCAEAGRIRFQDVCSN